MREEEGAEYWEGNNEGEGEGERLRVDRRTGVGRQGEENGENEKR